MVVLIEINIEEYEIKEKFVGRKICGAQLCVYTGWCKSHLTLICYQQCQMISAILYIFF